ncbi:hypothetical protein WN51_06263 [Melipona quadrifasciata]|uniref:Uncharacterized protein n=1 Tax=Melipona quadrifasciata TaxID=166423 RepID=A0A0M8ZQ74_9HYME|nr:hypothetical protein WN51_06263 [Melipona quadrifasciata]
MPIIVALSAEKLARQPEFVCIFVKSLRMKRCGEIYKIPKELHRYGRKSLLASSLDIHTILMNTTTSYAGATSTLAGMMGLESEMRMDKAGNSLDNDLDISPVTLSSAWSRMARLLLLASMAVGGSVGNVFMISAVVVEDQLKKRGIVTIFLEQSDIGLLDEFAVYSEDSDVSLRLLEIE